MASFTLYLFGLGLLVLVGLSIEAIFKYRSFSKKIKRDAYV